MHFSCGFCSLNDSKNKWYFRLLLNCSKFNLIQAFMIFRRWFSLQNLQKPEDLIKIKSSLGHEALMTAAIIKIHSTVPNNCNPSLLSQQRFNFDAISSFVSSKKSSETERRARSVSCSTKQIINSSKLRKLWFAEGN